MQHEISFWPERTHIILYKIDILHTVLHQDGHQTLNCTFSPVPLFVHICGVAILHVRFLYACFQRCTFSQPSLFQYSLPPCELLHSFSVMHIHFRSPFHILFPDFCHTSLLLIGLFISSPFRNSSSSSFF